MWYMITRACSISHFYKYHMGSQKEYSLGFSMSHCMSVRTDTTPKTVQIGIPIVPLDVCYQSWIYVIISANTSVNCQSALHYDFRQNYLLMTYSQNCLCLPTDELLIHHFVVNVTCTWAKRLSNSFCASVSLSICRWKVNIDRVERFPKLTVVALTLQKKVICVYLIGSKAVLYPLLFQQFPILTLWSSAILTI